MSEAPVALTRKEARASCDEQVARTARPLLLVTALLLFGFTLVTPFLTPFPASVPIAAAELALGVAFLAGHLVLKRPSGIRFVNPIFVALSLGALAASIVSFVQIREPAITSGVVLLILSAGIIMLSWPWVIAILAIYFFGWWATLAYVGGPAAWSQVIFTLAAAVTLSAMAHAARIRTHLHLEALRRQEKLQRDELESGLHALRVAQGRLQRVISAAPVVVLVTDAAGTLRLLEGRSLREHGWETAALVGQPAAQVLAGFPEELDKLERALRGESSTGMALAPGGATFDTFWSPALDEDGSVAGAMCVAIDVSARVRMVEEERKAAARESDIVRLQEMDRFKTRILNTASHELNTPLTPIKLQMHLLKSAFPTLDAKQQKAVAVLDRNVDRLANLVADIMDVARLQEGQLRMLPSRLDLADVVREAAASYEAVASAKAIRLAVDADAGHAVMGDPKRLMQVLFNLLGNATKFTPEGGEIHVTIRNGSDAVMVDVRDTGPGLTPEQIDRLFKPFSQVHDTARTSHGGTGLGLYISRGIAEQHGGTLTVASDGPGRGATFTLSLPVAPAP